MLPPGCPLVDKWLRCTIRASEESTGRRAFPGMRLTSATENYSDDKLIFGAGQMVSSAPRFRSFADEAMRTIFVALPHYCFFWEPNGRPSPDGIDRKVE